MALEIRQKMAPKVSNQIKEDEIIFSDSATSQKLLDLLEPILRCEKLKNVPKIIFNHCSACDDIFLDASANYDLNMFRQIFHKWCLSLIGPTWSADGVISMLKNLIRNWQFDMAICIDRAGKRSPSGSSFVQGPVLKFQKSNMSPLYILIGFNV